ncbi:carbohydrate-binding protein [Cysteiniphilum sp. 6C5]|uniref:carbohydrate-binding protein n=1 Tax=unclassified Cysteiniphilum TaxID=2610889 RepID=UPI003F85E352
MKRRIQLIIIALLMLMLGISISMYLQYLYYQHDNQIRYNAKPMSMIVGDDDDDDDDDTRPKLSEKNRDRSPSEAKQIHQELQLLKNSQSVAHPQYGTWLSKGPDNQPGCWQMTEFDERDNTVWGMTCGHSGGTQSIFKGSLAGDDFKLISGQLPYRFNSMIFTQSTDHKQRLLVAINNGQIKYTDNDGTTWQSSQGLLDNITQLIINRQTDTGQWKLYATDDQRVYVSIDDGSHFSVLEDFGSKQKMSLYSPRYNNQPNNGNVYLTRNGNFYQLKNNESTFTKLGSWQYKPSDRFVIGGDSRLLIICNRDDDYKYLTSTDGGASWVMQPGSSYPGDFISTDPENPNILIGGYMNPAFSFDGAKSFLTPNIWWMHQVALPNDQDMRSRVRIHADHGSSQFFYDKSGKLFTLNSTDGGIYRSYKDWTITDINQWTTGEYYDYQLPNEVYYNITLYGAQTAEIYRQSMVTGWQNPDDIVIGTQDQGDETSFSQTDQDSLLHFTQAPYGDGGTFISSELSHVIWQLRGNNPVSITPPAPEYNGSNFLGIRAISTDHALTLPIPYSANFRVMIDKEHPDNIVWIWNASKLFEAIWSNENQTYTLKYSSPNNSSGNFSGFDQYSADPNILYVIRGNSLYRSTDKGDNWLLISDHLPMNETSDCVLWVSPVDYKNILFYCPASTNNSWYSEDGGTTMQNVSGILPHSALIAQKLQGTPDGRLVFVGTTLGPFVFDTLLRQWFSLLDAKTPIFMTQDISYIPSINTIRFGTWGLGIYDFQITINPKLAFSQDKIDFNTSQQQSVTTKQITITNIGLVSAKLGKVTGLSHPLSTNFSQQCESKVLFTGDSCTFSINMDTSNVISGSQTATINIENSQITSDLTVNYHIVNDCQDPNAKQYPDFGDTTQDHYNAGDVVNYHKYLWQAQYWVSKNVVPTTPNSGWKLFEIPKGIVFKWDSSIAYHSGDVVAYNDNEYQAKWWTRGNKPSSKMYGQWKDLGTVSGTVCDRPS